MTLKLRCAIAIASNENVTHYTCHSLVNCNAVTRTFLFCSGRLRFSVHAMSSSSQTPSSSSNDATDYLRSASFSTGRAPVAGDDNAVTASDLLAGGFDPTRLHPMAGLKDQLEYLQLEDDKVSDLPGGTHALPSRGWSDDLCYGTGTTYLSGTYPFLLLIRHSLQRCSHGRRTVSYCPSSIRGSLNMS